MITGPVTSSLWSISGNQCTAVFARWSRTFPLSGKLLLLSTILEGGTWRKVTRSIDGWVYGIGARGIKGRHVTELVCILLTSCIGCSVLVCWNKYRHLNWIYPLCTANPSSVYWKGWQLNPSPLITINMTLVRHLDSLKLSFETFSTIQLTLSADKIVYLCHFELVTRWAHFCGNRGSCGGDSGGGWLLRMDLYHHVVSSSSWSDAHGDRREPRKFKWD